MNRMSHLSASEIRTLASLLGDSLKPISLLEIAAILSAACVGGVFFAFTSFVMPALERLDGASGIWAMRAINDSVLSSSFLVLLMGTGVLMLALLYFEPSLKGVSGTCILAAGMIYLIGTIGVTLIFNVPLNVRLEGVQDGDAAGWKSYVRDWTTWNSVRGLAAMASSALLLLAIVLRKSS